ncbi:MAG TPA: metallophosphoesterase family protein [Nitrospirota bacterium]|nr:metallophosphoesterase family protein [Nitrospirota bacterium]
MIVGVLSDTHIPSAVQSLPPVIFDIFKDVELILHAGDIVGLSVLDELRALAPVVAVAGNMDDPEVHARLPQKKIMTLGRYRVGLTHGKYKIDVQREMIRKEFDTVDLIVYGHSHTPFWGQVDGVYFLNPGSPTDKLHAPYNSVAVLEIGEELHAEIIRI